MVGVLLDFDDYMRIPRECLRWERKRSRGLLYGEFRMKGTRFFIRAIVGICRYSVVSICPHAERNHHCAIAQCAGGDFIIMLQIEILEDQLDLLCLSQCPDRGKLEFLFMITIILIYISMMSPVSR